MKVVLSPRVEAELVGHFEFGVARFGPTERTFAKVRRFIFESLPEHPHAAIYHPERDVFEHFIPNTPFIIFYRLNVEADEAIVLAIFHHSQDRSSFDG